MKENDPDKVDIAESSGLRVIRGKTGREFFLDCSQYPRHEAASFVLAPLACQDEPMCKV